MIKAMCSLHNYLRTINDPQYVPSGYADYVARDGTIQEGFWRQGRTIGVNAVATQMLHATAEASRIRNKFVDYFSSDYGCVPWQLDYIHRRH